jgi:hypothetical protein
VLERESYPLATWTRQPVPLWSLRPAQEPPITLRVRYPEESEGAAPLGSVRWWGSRGQSAAPAIVLSVRGEREALDSLTPLSVGDLELARYSLILWPYRWGG